MQSPFSLSSTLKMPAHLFVHQPHSFSPYDLPPLGLKQPVSRYPIFRQFKKDGNAGLRMLGYSLLQQGLRGKLMQPLQVNNRIRQAPVSVPASSADLQQQLLNQIRSIVPTIDLTTYFNQPDNKFDSLLVCYLRLLLLQKISLLSSERQQIECYGQQISPLLLLQLCLHIGLKAVIFTQERSLQSEGDTATFLFLHWKKTYAILYQRIDTDFQPAIFGCSISMTVQEVEKKKCIVSINSPGNPLHQIQNYESRIQQVENIKKTKRNKHRTKESSFAQFSTPLSQICLQEPQNLWQKERPFSNNVCKSSRNQNMQSQQSRQVYEAKQAAVQAFQVDDEVQYIDISNFKVRNSELSETMRSTSNHRRRTFNQHQLECQVCIQLARSRGKQPPLACPYKETVSGFGVIRDFGRNSFRPFQRSNRISLRTPPKLKQQPRGLLSSPGRRAMLSPRRR